MGAWGIHFTENDGALDFLGDLADSRDWDVVLGRLEGFVEEGGYEDAEEALAAAEIVAAALGKPSGKLDAELANWAKAQTANGETSRGIALQAVKLVLSESELNELWSEADEYAEWQSLVEDLISRLS